MPRVLIADNNSHYRSLLVAGLKEQGHDAEGAGDGLEALQIVAQEGFDAVVLDLVMPGLGGAGACRRLKADPRTRDLPVVVLSALHVDEIDGRGIQADAFVAKMQPRETVEHLGTTIKELLSGQLTRRARGFEGMHRREVVTELLNEQRSRVLLLDSLSEGFLRLSADGRVLEANTAAQEMLGVQEEHLFNRPLRGVLGCDAATEEHLRDEGCTPAGAEIRFPLQGRVVAARRSTVRDPDGESFVFLWDVTEVARAEERQQRLEKKVEASERMSALGEIVACVAQEMNTPLTGILGYADLLLRFSVDERSVLRLQKLQREAQRCRAVVENLLCFARKRQAYRREQDINLVVAKVVAATAPAADKAGVQVELDLASEPSRAEVDFALLEQALNNLITNALQALVGCRDGEGRIRISTTREDGRIVLQVADNGPGVSDEVRERIFEPFFTSRRAQGGAGLGLAVSYGIIQEHGGSIRALDDAEGACFRIELPASVARSPESEARTTGDCTGPAVLIVDDEPVVLDLMEDILTDSGFRVERAGNGAQALERLGEHRFDAVIIDLRMPDMDGRGLYEIIGERQPEMAERVIFTTGDPDTEAVNRLLADTGRELLRKPFRLEEVAATCRAVADASRE